MNFLDPLDKPFGLKSMNLKNRFVMSPMTRYFSPKGVPATEVDAYYRRRAEGGVGLIISEGVGIDRPKSRGAEAVPNFLGDALSRWKDILAGVHRAGAAMAPQLWHVGGSKDYNFPDEQRELESPSGLAGPDLPGGRAMSEEDVADSIMSFARAARAASEIGFDAVEVHAAHGYLVDQFFWAETNLRPAPFGGATLGERAQFAAEIIKAMREAVGPEMVLIMRISQWKTNFYDAKLATNPAELEAWLTPLVDAGIDIFDCSQRRFWEPEFDGDDRNLAGWVKKVVDVPTITVGSIGLNRDLFADFEQGGASEINMASIDELVRRFDRGDFDLVAMGRVLLADPDWLSKVRRGELEMLKPYSPAAMQTLY